MPAYKDTQLLIDGEWRDGAEGRSIDVLNPATGLRIGGVAHAVIADLDAALEAADRGFATWKAVSAFDRARIMRKAAELLRQRADAIAALMTMEQGKPLAQAKVEIMGSADIIDWFAGEAPRAYGQTIPARAPGVTQMTLKLPVGPVAAFSPWNFPISQVVRKLAAALAAGCSIIIKAPEETPASPAEMIRCFQDAGVPAGVIGLVFGVPAEISEHLIPSPIIRKVTFTGSTPVGKHLAALAGQHMKRVTMELGGHAPVIVTADADIERSVATMTAHKFRNAGQVCVSPTRFLVEDAAHGDYVEGFAAAAKALKVGSGLEDGVDMGPLANDRRIPALEAMIEDAISRGAKLVTGGRRIGNEGWFFEPTILADVPTDATIMNEEPFGPVAVVNRFSDIDDAIAEANRLPFGLAAYGWTGSNRVAQRLGAEVESGMMSINHLGLALPEVPFGGVQDSGYGTEGGSEALQSYLDTRFVTRLD